MRPRSLFALFASLGDVNKREKHNETGEQLKDDPEDDVVEKGLREELHAALDAKQRL